jgi:hypothetical protein
MRADGDGGEQECPCESQAWCAPSDEDQSRDDSDYPWGQEKRPLFVRSVEVVVPQVEMHSDGPNKTHRARLDQIPG